MPVPSEETYHEHSFFMSIGSRAPTAAEPAQSVRVHAGRNAGGDGGHADSDRRLSQAFAIVGETVAKGRAAIEISGNLRGVANQLQEDLTGLTVPVRPWTEDRSGEGYFEVVEGPMSSSFVASSDKDWNGDGVKETQQDSDTSGVYDVIQDADSNTVADILESDLALATQTHYGDIDDVLAFTTRNAATPFVGQYTDSSGTQQTAQSSLAEVVWWIQYDDKNDSGTREVEESFTIYRRVMLVRPDLGVVRSWVGAGNAFPNTQPGLATLHNSLADFFNRNDISVRLRWWLDGNGVNVRLTANSLADLTRRENRFAHLPILTDRGNSPPYLLANAAIVLNSPYDAVPRVEYDSTNDHVRIAGFGFPLDVNRRSVTSLYRAPKTLTLGHYGEDVMVPTALAFDVQVFDPTAPVRQGLTGEALVPSDPGYDAIAPPIVLGYGAFVDLGYGQRLTPLSPSLSTFSGGPQAKSRLVLPLANGSASTVPAYSYCTWSGHYECNGVDDDVDSPAYADEGTDGFDSDSTNGVDDVGERETSPPYPVPLRGIQVKIRAIEPDSRQIRQVTVVSDFIPE